MVERELTRAGVAAPVLRFGMDGAPLSQYLHVLRHEVRAFKPDVVLVQLIHNDFDESYRCLKTRYASSSLKIGFDGAGQPRAPPSQRSWPFLGIGAEGCAWAARLARLKPALELS